MGTSKISVGFALFLVSTFGLATPASASSSVLGSAGSFAVLAGSGITNTGYSDVTGDMGSHPTPAFEGAGEVTARTGTKYSDTDIAVANAKRDLARAYDNIYWRVPTETVFGDIGGRTLDPGVYHSSRSIGLTGTVTLDGGGDPAAMFVFQSASTLMTASGSRVALVNGAQAANVFWQVGSSATFGAYSRFSGTVLALTSITATTGASFVGCLLARNGAVTLDSNRIGGGCGDTALLGSATPDPATPDPATPDPATPDPASPDPAAADTAIPDTVAPVTPETATLIPATSGGGTPDEASSDSGPSATLGALAGGLLADLTASVVSVLAPNDPETGASHAATLSASPAANLASVLGAASSRVQKVFADTLTAEVSPAVNFSSAMDTAGARARGLAETSTTRSPPEGNWFWALIEPGANGGGPTGASTGEKPWVLIEPGAKAVALVEASAVEGLSGSEGSWALIERGEKLEAFMCSPVEGALDSGPFDTAQR